MENNSSNLGVSMKRVVLIISLLCVAISLVGCGSVVPDVSGMTLPQAKKSIIATGLIVGSVAYDETASGTFRKVINQTPKAGERASSDSKISLTLAGPPDSKVFEPVKKILDGDSRNAAFSLEAHYGTDAQTLVLDLIDAGSAAPADLWRGLFQSASALESEGLNFSQVVLARNNAPVFLLDGDEFSTIGDEYGYGENPLYLIRTLPEKLKHPDGQPAYDTWTGGWLGVTAEQIEDANEAASEWAR